MNIPVKKWYEAVQTRYSQQKYMTKEIKPFTLKSLEKKFKELNETYPEVRVEIIEESVKEILPALKGKYGNFTDSPAFIAFIAPAIATEEFFDILFAISSQVLSSSLSCTT
jgi:hypothetical protein